MIVAMLQVSILIEGAQSLKDKRRVLKSLIEKARRDFGVSIAEVDDHDLWNSSVVGVACVSDNAIQAESVLQHLMDRIDGTPEIEVTSVERWSERY